MSRDNKKRYHNYRKAIEQAVANETPILPPGSVSVIHVYHDDWCDIFNGGLCNCKPDLVQEVKPKDGQP